MTKLIWGAAGERFFEAGVDRGVLYVPGLSGVAWNGLTSVSEAPSGGEPQPYYIDGFKYANIASAEEFNASLEAFSSPDEFAVCDGSVQLAAGLFATQQPRKQFDLSYRTMVGNDLLGLDAGYKIHIVYNALAGSAGRSNGTLTSSFDPIKLSWDISTRPPEAIYGFKPTAHFVIDSRKTPPMVVSMLESILYGSASTMPRVLPIVELMDLFNAYLEIELFVERDNSGVITDELVPAYLSPTAPPPLAAGEEILWLDNSSGDITVLNLVTGV